MHTASRDPRALSVQQVLLCGALIVTLSMGIRHGFGLWLQPLITERGWTRETFSFTIAVQTSPGALPVRSPACWRTASAPGRC